MNLSKDQNKIFSDTWDRCLNHLIEDLIDTKKIQMEIMREHKSDTDLSDWDFCDFAKESFLHRLKSFHDHHYDTEAAIQEAKKIIRGDYDETESVQLQS